MAHPETLGRYTIKTLLGQGAMGVVYKAYDPGIGRLVALKTIRHALSQDRQADASLADRFRNEARAVGRINHPGIVAIYELGQDGDCAFIAMEYVEGRDLSQILAVNPALPEVDVLRVMHQLLDALECAHQHGVWHRDIKPANLIITTNGQVKVTDFGIARIETAALTLVTSTIGTPGYMAPEQYIGESFDHRVDLFAAGVLLFRMLAGQAPFSGTPEAVMYGIMTKETPSLSAFLPPEVAEFYDPIVTRALAKDPAQRYPSAAAFREALRRRSSEVASNPSEKTVILEAADPTSTRSAAQGAENPSVGQSPQTLLTNWEEGTLAPVQAALARCVGPLAKVLVRQAAKKCTELQTLVSLVSQDIPNAEDRAKFLETLRQPTVTKPVDSGPQALPTSGSTSGAQVTRPLEAALIEKASLLMTRHMGPIAKVVVKKAAAKAVTSDQFVAALAQELPEGPQRTQLINALS